MGYKVGDLDVTISGVSKDAVSSLDEVIKKLDDLQGKLGIVSKGFNGAFNGAFGGISNTTARATVKGLTQIQQATESATESVGELNDAIQNGAKKNAEALTVESESAAALFQRLSQLSREEYSREQYSNRDSAQLYQDIQQTISEINQAKVALSGLQQEFVDVYTATDEEAAYMRPYEAVQREIQATEQNITALEEKLSELNSVFGRPFDEARAKVSQLSSELLNLHFSTGDFDESKVREMLSLTSAINQTTEAFKRLSMTEEELALYDNKQVESARNKRIEFLKLSLVTNSAGESAEEYKKELISLSREEYELAQSMKALEKDIKSHIEPIGLMQMSSELEQATTRSSELKRILTEMAYSTGNLDNGKVRELQELTKNINAANEAVKRALMTEEEKALADFEEENATRKQRIAYLQLALATGQAAEKTREYRRELKELEKEQKKADEAAGKQKKGIFEKLVERIARISFYRTIRRGLQILVQTFTESVQSFAQVDENINKTMSQLTSSAKVIQLSFGTILLPIVQAITPVVQQLSYGFANMANAISASMAKMQGLSTYTKINADALQDYQKQLNKTSGALFDFDKFRALSSSSDDNSIFFETADVNEELENTSSLYTGIFDTINSIGGILADVLSIVGQIAEAAIPILGVVSEIVGFVVGLVKDVTDFLDKTGRLEPILYGILGVLTLIGAAKIITWISSGGITKALTSLVSTLKVIPTALSALNTAIHTTMGQFALWGVAITAVTGAVKLLSNWDDFSKGTKIAITVISGLATALLGAATAAMMLHGSLTLGAAIPLITAAIASGVVFIRGLVDIPNYAVGASDIDSGSLFVAGEAGKTEMVYTGDNGKTNVANVQQMAQAVYQGVYQATTDWWKSAKTDVGGDVYLDGEKIYQNTTSHAKKHGNKWTSV